MSAALDRATRGRAGSGAGLARSTRGRVDVEASITPPLGADAPVALAEFANVATGRAGARVQGRP